MTFWIANWLRIFAFTLALELIVAVPLLARVEPRVSRRAAGVALANLATHPVVWFVIPGAALGPAARWLSSELWAFAIELLAYRLIWPALGLRRAALVSLAANACSALSGYALQRWMI